MCRRGTAVKLKLATVVAALPPIPERRFTTLMGNLAPQNWGREVIAKTQEDLYVDDNKAIPEGSTFHGIVSGSSRPSGWDGQVVRKFLSTS